MRNKLIAGLLATCMFATDLSSTVVYAQEQTVDITSTPSAVTDTVEVSKEDGESALDANEEIVSTVDEKDTVSSVTSAVTDVSSSNDEQNENVESESTNTENKVDDETHQDPGTEEKSFEEYVLLAPEAGGTVEANIGDIVTFMVDGSRDDVDVIYQWQVFQNESVVDTGSAIYDYSNGEATWYRFPLTNTTEAETLETNPSAVWPGVELYYAVVEALDEIGEDVSTTSIAYHTQNYVLQGYSISAENDNGNVTVYADKNGTRIAAILNEDGKWQFDDTESEQQGTWNDIDGATEKDYSFEVTEDVFDKLYRCKVTVTDEDYLNECKAYLASAGTELTDKELAVEQVLYSVTMNVHSDEWDEQLKQKLQKNLVATYALNSADGVRLSDDGQWIEGLSNQYEYITKDTYDKITEWLNQGKITETQYKYYWTRLGSGGWSGAQNRANVLDENGMPTGEIRPYNGFDLTDGAMEVLSEWYGKTVLFRVRNSTNITEIDIPAYTDLTKDKDGNYIEAASGSKYKKAVTILNPYMLDSTSMYKAFLGVITQDGWLADSADSDIHIQMYIVDCESFNKDPERYMVDAEGNYRMDAVAWGVCTYQEPDISGKAYWTLKDYIANGYGFMTGHDTLYAYAGSYYDATLGQETFDESSIDPDDGVTWYYDLNSWLPGTTGTSSTGETSTTRGGHFYLNQLMGSNKGNVDSGTTIPSDAPSLILSTGGSHGNYSKDIQFGSNQLEIQQSGYSTEDAIKEPKFRTPTNYPYEFVAGGRLEASETHTNQQAAFGTIWVNYYGTNHGVDKGYYADPKTWEVDGKTGTNNFYVTGNGNYLMNQIGHLRDNMATRGEARLFTNSLMYISQRKQCEICAANQNNQQTSHFVYRVNSTNFKTITDALRSGGNYWYPIDGCYMLTENITLPDDWTPIKSFRGHWSNDVYKVTLAGNDYPVFFNYSVEGEDGWNLGNNRLWGPQNVFDGLMKKRTTGVARVVGDLNDLFGTDMNYSGYEVHILGTDNLSWLGETADYGCTVNSDSKYVISNVPCVYEGNGKGILKARVYKPDGTEVDEYGDIYVNVDQSFWNTENTTPLYLGSFSVDPVGDYTTYESGQAYFWSMSMSTSAVSLERWEYRESADSEWKAIPSDWDTSLVVQDVTPADAENYTLLHTELALNKVDPHWDGYQFRAVYKSEQNGTWNSYGYYWHGAKASNEAFDNAKYKEVFTSEMTGTLTVKLWPVYAEQGANQTVSESDSATFTASGFALDDGTAITATWQYGEFQYVDNGENIYTWTDIDTTDEFGNLQVVTETARKVENRNEIINELRSVSPDNNEELFWKKAQFHRVDTSLTVKKLDIRQDSYKFRVHFQATTVFGTTYDWYSDIADDMTGAYTTVDGSLSTFAPAAKQDNSNILHVIPPELRITTMKSMNFIEGSVYPDLMTPDEYGQTLILSNVNDVVSQGPAAYRAVIYYRPDELTPTPVWQYNTYSDRTARTWNQSVANGLGYSGMTVTITNSAPVDVVYNGEAGWKAITSTMTLKNVPVTMYNSEKLLKYYFRCVGAATYSTVKEEKTLAATDKWGGLSMDYAIAVWHNGVLGYNNENIINGTTVTTSSGLIAATKDHDYSDWYYPKLKIKLPTNHHVNTAIISFDDSADSRDALLVDTTAINNAGIDVIQSTARYLVISSKTKDAVELATWEKILQTAVGFRTYEEVDYTKEGIENGTTGGAPIRWIVDENRFSGTTYDPDTGHLYKVVDLGNKAKWDYANQKAMSIDDESGMSGYLAEISDATENAKVQKLLNGRTAWIGGVNNNSTWKWNNSGNTIGYANWTSNPTYDAANMYIKPDGTWNSGPTYQTTHPQPMVEYGWTAWTGKSTPEANRWEVYGNEVSLQDAQHVYLKFAVTGLNGYPDGNLRVWVQVRYKNQDWWQTVRQGDLGMPVNENRAQDPSQAYGMWIDSIDASSTYGSIVGVRLVVKNWASSAKVSALVSMYVKAQEYHTVTEEVNPVTAAVIEYEPQSLAFATTTHSASDNTVIGTKAKSTIVETSKEVSAIIKGNTKIYDGQQIEPSFFSVYGDEGATSDLFEIKYEVADKVDHSGYVTRTVSGTDYKTTGAVNAARYHATVSLTQKAIDDGWKLDTAQSQLECELIINQRPVNLYSYHNNKQYDHTSAGVINNISMLAADDKSGVITGDVVLLNANTAMGSYFDAGGKTTSHNVVTYNNGAEYTMGRNSKLSPLYIVHSDTSDPYYNYRIGTEDYTGAITQIGVQVHSLYLEEPDMPRNVKTYDSTNAATIKDIVIDGILPDDKKTVGLKKATLSGTYTTASAGETLTADGKAQSDRSKKLAENVITATEHAELTGNDYGDYFIESESYSGAIMRAPLDVRTRSDNFMYGDASIASLKNDYKNALITVHKNTKFNRNSTLTVSGLLGADTLTLNLSGKVTLGPVAKTENGLVPITLNENLPVGKYTVATTGLTETNFDVLKNYIIDEIDGVVEVTARPIVIRANGSDLMAVDDVLPTVSTTFSMLATDGSAYVEIGTDDAADYADMNLVGTDTVASTIFVTDGAIPAVGSTDSVLTKDAALVSYKQIGDGDSRYSVFSSGSNIPYSTGWYKFAPAKYLNPDDILNETQPDCDWCTAYYGTGETVQHAELTGYNLTVNRNKQDANVLVVGSVQNPNGETVQNYTLSYETGTITPHPSTLKIQLTATVPLYVCMYGYAGDGEVVEPTNYGIKNYTQNSDIVVNKITVGDVSEQQVGWNIVDKDRKELQRGEMSMLLNDTQLVEGDNTPADSENWIIAKDDSDDNSGVDFNIPMTCFIAGGNVNSREESFVTKVTYTIAPVKGNAASGGGGREPVDGGGGGMEENRGDSDEDVSDNPFADNSQTELDSAINTPADGEQGFTTLETPDNTMKVDIGEVVDGLDTTDFIEDGKTYTPNIIWNTDSDTESPVEDKDYEVTGQTTETSAGEYTITITGKGDYYGSYDLTWSITEPNNINSAVVGLEATDFTYDGKTHVPTFKWRDGYEDLVEGVEYVISGDKTASKAGYYNIVISGIGDYVGKVQYTWAINDDTMMNKPNIASLFSRIDKSVFVYDGTVKSPTIIWKDGEELIEGVDYRIIGSKSATDDAQYSFSIFGEGKYKGYIFVKWNIVKSN